MWNNFKRAAHFADFEELLADTLMSQFTMLGGNPEEAVRSARKYARVGEWVSYHKAQTVAAGVGSGILPGASVLLMSADLSFLLHKLAYMSWGIGAIRGCKVHSKPDFLRILQIWSEMEDGRGDLMAVSYGFVKAVDAAVSLSSLMQLAQLDEAQQLAVYNELGRLYQAHGKVSSAIDSWGNYEGVKGVKVKIARKKLLKISAKLSQKLAKKLASKIASKIAAKYLLGMLPLLGAAASGYINHWMMEGIANSALAYYGKPIRL